MPNGHFSFPSTIPLVIYPLLALGVGTGAGRWWGIALTVLAGLMACLFTWEALSRREFEAIQKKDPSLNRATWRLNWLLFYVLPAVLVTGYGVVLMLRR
jgi:hypothetical protein